MSETDRQTDRQTEEETEAETEAETQRQREGEKGEGRRREREGSSEQNLGPVSCQPDVTGAFIVMGVLEAWLHL